MNSLEAGFLGGVIVFFTMFVVLFVVVLKYENRLDEAERRV